MHPWDVSVEDAKDIQRRLRESLKFVPFKREKFYVAGIDVSYKKVFNASLSAIVVMEYPSMEVVDSATYRLKTTFPYIPGFLSFREAPAIFKAWEMLKVEPDLLVFDGQGIAHPRGIGLASHVGILLDKPSIGCAKSHLYGKYKQPSLEKGAFTYLKHPASGEVIGAVLRSRRNVSCIYVSPGHLMDVESSIRIIFSLVDKYRLPEPVRLAHIYSKKGWEDWTS